MWLQTVLVALFAAQVFAGAALYGGALTEEELINTLIQRQDLIPASSRRVLAERTRQLSKLSKRQAAAAVGGEAFNIAIGTLLSGLTNMGKKAPVSKVPEVQQSESPEFSGAKRVKIRYGPYRVPPTSEKSLESQWLNQQGLTSTYKFFAKKPCDGNCLLLKLSASIEYDNGETAENANGAWFHHAVVLNIGTTVKDPVCGLNYLENIYMAGNEKTEAEYSVRNSSVKTGYHLLAQDAFVLNTELMNMEDKEKWVWLTLTFDYLDGEHREYKDGKIVWMTISQALCSNDTTSFGPSNLTASSFQPLKKVFSEHSMPWTVPADLELLGTAGHMHDGAESMDIFHNGKLICTSVPEYAKSAKAGMSGSMGGPPMGGGGHGHGGRRRFRRQLMGGTADNTQIEHIERQLPCKFEPPVVVKKGDKMYLSANYNLEKHPGMKTAKGELDMVMGIAGSTVALPYPRQ